MRHEGICGEAVTRKVVHRGTIAYARMLADEVARNIHSFPYILGYPPRLWDVDECYSTWGLYRSQFIPATHPRGEEKNA